MRSAVLLLSSGLDSAANLALAREFKIELALTIDYGQLGAARELAHAAAVARHFGVEHSVFDLRDFLPLTGGRSAIMGGQLMPTPDSLDDLAITTKSANAVWVPNRNGVMISIAAALAESRGFNAVAVGFNAEEAVTFPDNTPEYMRSMTGSLKFSTANHVEVVSATAPLTKREIVAQLATESFPFELLWSCYHAFKSHCGRCESCQRLKRALGAGLSGETRSTALHSLFGEEAT